MIAPLVALALAAHDPAALQAKVDALVKKHDLPSGAAAVVEGGQVSFTTAWGPRRDDPADPVDRDAVFRIGSITKTFTALAVVQLRDAGKLSLDDPLAKWIPEATLRPAKEGDRPPTLRDVLTHRSGLPRVGKLHYAQEDHDLTEAELLAALKDVKLESTPGAKEAYSNLGYAALGLVVQRASGERYRDYVTAHLLRPLGMATACWDGAEVPEAHRVWGHVRRFFFFGSWRTGGTRWRMGAAEAAGGLYASAPELARLALFELGDGDLGPLKRASVRETQMPPGGLDKEPHQGLGMLASRGPNGLLLFKNGALENWSSTVVMLSDRKLAVILLTAGETDDTDSAALELMRFLNTGK